MELIVLAVVFNVVSFLIGILFLGTSTQALLAIAFVLGLVDACMVLGVLASKILDVIL